MARQSRRRAIIAAEREATIRDTASAGARAEYEIWEGSLTDGIE
jgi:hypothetical protein